MNGRFCVDTNVFITAWDISYPKDTFPSLWNEIAKHKKDITLIKPIYDEINPMSESDKNKTDAEKTEKYPLRMWLQKRDFTETPIDEKVERLSLELEKKYETDTNSRGADQNDIKLIAYAKIENKPVVTLEASQVTPPKNKSNYKIPLICLEQGIECLNFVQMIRRLEVKI